MALLQKSFKGEIQIPTWLIISKTILIPKNTNTHLEKNYRPIACLNITYLVYTSMLNHFLDDHCTSNDIITVEQAGGKKGSWGCADQLLINKMVLDEVRKYKRNLFMMWFDYQKAFDSIPHQWLFKSLKLVKVPTELIRSIENLSKSWSTKVELQTKEHVSVSNLIKYLTGILQGDCLSLLLCSLRQSTLPPFKHTMRWLQHWTTHLLFVGDLKTYTSSQTFAHKQLDLITQFTNDIGMCFGVDKCAYTCKRERRKQLAQNWK